MSKPEPEITALLAEVDSYLPAYADVLINEFSDQLTSKEESFVLSVLDRWSSPTPKQQSWLDDIFRRCKLHQILWDGDDDG